MTLFNRKNVVGVFSGFAESGLEFRADLSLPYRADFQRIPMHGRFMLVQLDDDNEAALGRITKIVSGGRLSSPEGEEMTARAASEDRPIPEDLREQYVKYRITIRMLGVLRKQSDGFVFASTHRRMPHVGNKVAFLDEEAMRYVANAHDGAEGAEIGYLAFGDFIYAQGCEKFRQKSQKKWMQIMPHCAPRFRVGDMVSRRTMIFARAGFGKSNLVKLLFANLYGGKNPPTAQKHGEDRRVGTIVFDPDGEYFWPDDKGRPGLCDVEELESELVLFTERKSASAFYQSFVADGVKLDLRRLRPTEVIPIALPPEQQGQQNVRKLCDMRVENWNKLVDLIYANGNWVDLKEVAKLIGADPEKAEFEALAARSNMTHIVKMLHDPSSQTIDKMFASLKRGKICVFDASKLRGQSALALSGIVLRKIFHHNQKEFVKDKPQTIPTIAVIEEAQSVLGGRGVSCEPYIEWVKEGRKYDLGAVLVTQQPRSIPGEILSQGDNWFVFHLLSSDDLFTLEKANAHFSKDILSSLLNEPIPGHCVFWSSVSERAYPLSIRISSFEESHAVRDAQYRLPASDRTEASLRREKFDIPAEKNRQTNDAEDAEDAEDGEAGEKRDVLRASEDAAIAAFCKDDELRQRIKKRGLPWFGVVTRLEDNLPSHFSDRNPIAHRLVSRAMDEIYGKNEWDTESRPAKSHAGTTTWIVPKKKSAGK